MVEKVGYKELFKIGMSFDTFLSTASEEEKEKIATITKVIKISDELVEKIEKLDQEYNFLLSAEPWCPYVRATLPVLIKMTELNPKIKLKIITEGRGFMFLREKLEISEESYVIPTLAVLDKNFDFVAKYVGRPSKYRKIGFDIVKEKYFTGHRSDDIVEEILERIEKR